MTSAVNGPTPGSAVRTWTRRSAFARVRTSRPGRSITGARAPVTAGASLTISRGQVQLLAVHQLPVQLHLAVLGDHRHLRPLAVHIDSNVNRYCRASFSELVLSPGASRYRAEQGTDPALIGSEEEVLPRAIMQTGSAERHAGSDDCQSQRHVRSRSGRALDPA